MIQLDSADHTQVDSVSRIEIDVAGQPNQKMVILSGIARPEWEVTDDDHLYGETVDINLRETVLAVVSATASVGLASIYNNNTKFQFGCNSTSLSADPKTQQLHLTVDVALRGDFSILNRFGYQVVALVTTQSTGISGTIRWSKSLFDPSHLSVGQQQALFLIAANEVTVSPPSGGGFGSTTYRNVANGSIGGIISDSDDFITSYNIPGAPYNQPIVVTILLTDVFTPLTPAGPSPNAGPPVILTVTKPAVSGGDFRIYASNVR